MKTKSLIVAALACILALNLFTIISGSGAIKSFLITENIIGSSEACPPPNDESNALDKCNVLCLIPPEYIPEIMEGFRTICLTGCEDCTPTNCKSSGCPWQQ